MRVNLPDGTVANFPEGTPPEVMKSAIQDYLMKQTVATGEERAVTGAQTRAKAPKDVLPLATFIKDEWAGPAPGTPGGTPLRPKVALGIAGAAGMAPAIIGAPLATGASLAGGVGGKIIGSKLGRWGGPELGLSPETGAQIGGLLGALGGAISPQGLMAFIKAGGDPKALIAAFAPKPAQVASKVATAEAPVAAQTATAPALSPGAASAAANIERTLVESGATQETARQAAQNAIARMPAEAALPTQMSQAQIALVSRLRGLAQNNPADKIKIIQAAQELFPTSWQEVMKMIMAKNTKLPTIYTP